MKHERLLGVISLLQIAIALVLGLAGEMLASELALTQQRLFIAAILLVIVMLAISLRLLTPSGLLDSDTAFVIPLHWSILFQIGLFAGYVLGFFTVGIFGNSTSFGNSHTYEVVGLLIGIISLLAMYSRPEELLKFAAAVGYGLALPSAILLADRANNLPSITYAGHLGVMTIAALLTIIFRRYVRIKIVN